MFPAEVEQGNALPFCFSSLVDKIMGVEVRQVGMLCYVGACWTGSEFQLPYLSGAASLNTSEPHFHLGKIKSKLVQVSRA